MSPASSEPVTSDPTNPPVDGRPDAGDPAGDAPVPTPAAAGATPRRRYRSWRTDAAVIVGYLCAGVYLTGRLWVQPGRMARSPNDEMLFEWMLAHAARAVAHLENPLFSTRLNVPDGVNLMANTSVLGLGVPLTPVTLLFGSHAAFLVAVIVSLAGTAAGWYLLFSRSLRLSRRASALGGLFCGFAPGLVSQATGHLQFAAQFLVPAIVAALLALRRGRVLRVGIGLGLLVAYQLFLSEELLLILALAGAVGVLGYAVVDRRALLDRLVPLAAGLGVAALTAGALLAYPLWFQFRGPGHYRSLPFDPSTYFMDLGSYGTYARQSLTGYEGVPGLLSPNATEENSFFGLALIVLSTVIVIWLWRNALVKVLAAAGILFGALSLGPEVRVNGAYLGLPGPYRLLADLPILDLAIPARLALVLVPIIGLLVALSIDAIRAAAPDRATDRAATDRAATEPATTDPVTAGRGPVARRPAPVRLLWTGALVAALLPLAPVPLKTVEVAPVPAFLTDGTWRRYVPAGRTVVPVPPTEGGDAIAGMYWAARASLAFPVPGGYFIGPTSRTDTTGHWGAPFRPTATLLANVAATGQVPTITDRNRREAIEDLRYWRAAIVVEGYVYYGWPLKHTLDALLGPSQFVHGAWVWDVRRLVG